MEGLIEISQFRDSMDTHLSNTFDILSMASDQAGLGLVRVVGHFGLLQLIREDAKRRFAGQFDRMFSRLN